MTKNRYAQGGWAKRKELPKGPNGRNLCRECDREVEKGRQTFCSSKCVTSWNIRTGNHLDVYVRSRDFGVCKWCKRDCEILMRAYKAQRGLKARQEFKTAYGIPQHRNRRFWDIDHIVPVEQGGGECGLENLQTLCWKCHSEKTKLQRTEKAALKRQIALKPVESGREVCASDAETAYPEGREGSPETTGREPSSEKAP